MLFISIIGMNVKCKGLTATM